MRYVLEKVLEKEVSEEKLVNLNLVHVASGIKYMTNAAAILLGAMDNCCIKCARFMGDSVLNFIDRKEYSRDLFEQINSAIGFIKSHINLSGFISNNGLRRKDILEIPEEVIREAVINAVVHRDYSIHHLLRRDAFNQYRRKVKYEGLVLKKAANGK